MVTTNTNEYDVVIMGAGFAGVCQARHLLLNVPNIKIALIDLITLSKIANLNPNGLMSLHL
jgi:NADH dehydrogenase FAD-containing subunit